MVGHLISWTRLSGLNWSPIHVGRGMLFIKVVYIG